jgi:hypothetical protein
MLHSLFLGTGYDSHLHDQLDTGLDHSFQGDLLLLQLLSVFPQPPAQGFQLRDLLA